MITLGARVFFIRYQIVHYPLPSALADGKKDSTTPRGL